MDATDSSFKKGILLFKEGKYNDSIKVFREVIQAYKAEFSRQKEQLLKNDNKDKLKSSEENSKKFSKNFVNASDCISAAYLKINQPENALRYAKAMVSHQPLGCKGYLRLSKVYLFTNSNKEAYLVLRKGYLKIKEARDRNGAHNDPLYQQLKDEVKRMKAIVDPSKTTTTIDPNIKQESISTPVIQSTDPLLHLPHELIGLIFRQFPLSFKLECLTVCRLWNETLMNPDTVIFRDFHLKKNIRKQELVKFLKFLNTVDRLKYLNSINLEPHESVEQSCLELFFSNRLIPQGSFKINLIQINYFGLLPYIKKGKVNFSNLKSLNLGIPFYVDKNARLEETLKLCPHLEKLILVVPKFDSRSNPPDGNFIVLPKLKFLSVTVKSASCNSPMNNILLNSFLLNNLFPVLEHLTLSRVRIDQTTLKSLITPHLEIVELQDIPDLSIVTLLDSLLDKIEPRKSVLKEIRMVETDTTMVESHRDWKNELTNSRILSNLHTLMLRNSCITPSLLDNILLASSGRITTLHLVLNRNLVFQNRLTSSSIQTPYEAADVASWIMKIPKIRELSLVGCPGFNRLSLADLINAALPNHIFDKLNYLNLSMNKIEGDSLMLLFKKPFNLKLCRLGIEYCHVNPETVRYLLEKKICTRIDYKMDDRVLLE